MSGNKLMLGLKDSTDNYCEYEPRTVLVKQRKGKADIAVKESALESNMKEHDNLQSNILILQDKEFQNQSIDSKIIQKEMSNLSLYESSQSNNEDNSKPFIGSIGSWINDFFTMPTKKLHSSKIEPKQYEKEDFSVKDVEYFKSVNALKEQFKKKLKSETSVHVSGGDKSIQFNFNKVTESERKKRSKSLPNSRSSENSQEFSFSYENQQANVPPHDKPIRRQQRMQSPLAVTEKKTKSKNIVNFSSSNLVKEKKKGNQKRSEISELEEYVFPSPSDLSKRLLLNINDQDKCSRLYKNTHTSAQDIQHYGTRKNKAYQSSTRCYTTNANLTESSENALPKYLMAINNKSRGCHFYTTDSISSRANDESIIKKSSYDLRKKSFHSKVPRKTFSEFFRESSSFVKVKSPKSLVVTNTEPTKSDLKSSSDELVKYLMKKIKVNHRPQTQKKKSTFSPVVSSNKTRFMQSATNSLVMSVIAKKENDGQLTVKNSSRTSPDNKLVKVDLITKPNLGNLKYSDNNIRFDIKRAISQNKFNKNSYLEENKMGSEDCLIDKTNYKNARRSYEDVLKRDVKENSEKYNKRQEVRNMLSKIDVKSNPFQVNKAKQREEKKKCLKSSLDNFKVPDVKEAQNPRFQKQHELFKNNFKTFSTVESNQESTDLEQMKDADSDPSFSTQLAVIQNSNLQLLPENSKDSAKCETAETDEPENSSSPLAIVDSELKVIDCLSIDEKSINSKPEKNKLQDKHKDKLFKTKSLQFIKDDSKSLLGPLTDYCQNELPNTKDSSKVYESAICTPDLRPVKSLDSVLLNRRYSTNTLIDANSQKQKFTALEPRSLKTALFGSEPIKDNDKSKREPTEKMKEELNKKAEKENVFSDKGCGFEKVKKPGPNCEKENFVP